MSSSVWKTQAERGSAFWIGVLAWLAVRLGRSLTVLLLWPIAAYFLVTGTAARAASRHYLRRALGREPRRTEILRHFHRFAVSTLDRLLILSGQTAGFTISRSLQSHSGMLAKPSAGCIVLLAHFGNFEILRSARSLAGFGPIRLVMDREHGRLLTGLLERRNPAFAASIIDSGNGGPELALRLREALDRGNFVGIMADRVRPGGAQLEVDFLGGRAVFPAGPWNLAAVMKVPVLAAFAASRKGCRYEIGVELLTEGIDVPRSQRAAAVQRLAQNYAGVLERQVREAPYNWFNFYDFWHDEAAQA